jgi:hypothetical protein
LYIKTAGVGGRSRGGAPPVTVRVATPSACAKMTLDLAGRFHINGKPAYGTGRGENAAF